MSRLYLFINGICHESKDYGWNDRARDWVWRETDDDAWSYEYETGLLRPRGGMGNWTRDCLNLVATRARGREVILAGHSNGCGVVLNMLRECRALKVKAIHLVAAAVPAHCGVNGINDAVRNGQAGDIYLYGSGNDRALWAGGLSHLLAGWFGRGYGDLGRHGAVNLSDAARAKTTFDWRNSYDHSTWFEGEKFHETMKLLTR